MFILNIIMIHWLRDKTTLTTDELNKVLVIQKWIPNPKWSVYVYIWQIWMWMGIVKLWFVMYEEEYERVGQHQNSSELRTAVDQTNF
jgi:hypothetical protein